MTSTTPAVSAASDLRKRIIVALDVENAIKALQIVEQLEGRVGAFKVGLQLFTAAGPEFVRKLTRRSIPVFLDLKFHDIPNTVAKASVEAARLGVWMFNMHASGGSDMMKRAAVEVDKVCQREGLKRPLMIAVTVLTSSCAAEMAEIGADPDIDMTVMRLARLTAESGLDGVVASPHEAASIKQVVNQPDFVTVTPGIRPNSATGDDQRRVTTFERAVANGADYVVIGRPIIQAEDRVKAVEAILRNGPESTN